MSLYSAFLPGSPAGLYLETTFGVSTVILIQVILGLLGLVLLGYSIYAIAAAVAGWRRTFHAELVGKDRFLLGETVRFKAWFKGELKNGLFTCKVQLPDGNQEWWPAYDTFRRSENGDLGVLSGRKVHEAEWSVLIAKRYPIGQYAVKIGVWDRVDLGSKNTPVKEKQASFWVLAPGFQGSPGVSSGDAGFVTQGTETLNAEKLRELSPQPELIIPMSELESKGEVKELEVRFPNGDIRKGRVCFYYVTVRAKGLRTVENVFASLDGNPLNIAHKTEKPSFGVYYDRYSPERFDEAKPLEFVYALIREQKKVVDRIRYLHPGPGQEFVLFYGVEGLNDFYTFSGTYLWYDPRRGLCGLVRDDGTGTVKLMLHLEGQDAKGCNLMFEVNFRKWDSFSVNPVKLPQQL